MNPITPQEKQVWQAPRLEVIQTEETQAGTIPSATEDTMNNPSMI